MEFGTQPVSDPDLTFPVGDELKKKICFRVLFYLFLKETERQSVSRGGAEREGDRESETGSGL